MVWDIHSSEANIKFMGKDTLVMTESFCVPSSEVTHLGDMLIFDRFDLSVYKVTLKKENGEEEHAYFMDKKDMEDFCEDTCMKHGVDFTRAIGDLFRP